MLSDRIKQALKANKVARKDAAKRAGMPYTTLSELITGRMRSTTQMIALATALRVSPEWLATGRGDMDTVGTVSQPVGIDSRILTKAARRICSLFTEDSMVFDIESEDDVALLVAVYMDELAKERPETTEATIVAFQRIRKIKGDSADGGVFGASNKAPKAG